MFYFNLILSAVAVSILSTAHAEQTAIPDFKTARERIFYSLYETTAPRDTTDVYCGLRFSVEMRNDGKGLTGPKWINLEHAFPAQWMAANMKCGDRKTCADAPTIGVHFSRAEADLHNLWPSASSLNSSRGQRPYGMIEGEEPYELTIGEKTFSCDFENNGILVEPRKVIQGNLARSIFYMCDEYDFRVPKGMMPILRKWNRDDPPTSAERNRADRITSIQGTRNKFIDNPSLGNTLRCRDM